jgi:hypothetical protein
VHGGLAVFGVLAGLISDSVQVEVAAAYNAGVATYRLVNTYIP